LTGLQPRYAVEGGRVTLLGNRLPVSSARVPSVRLGDTLVPPSFASPHEIAFIIPPGLDGGRLPVRLDEVPGETLFLDVGRPIATGLHQVDSPVIDREGNLYVTFSGSRGQKSGVSLYRVRPDGAREVFVTGITNATSMALDRDGRLYVSSRFDGSVSRIDATGGVHTVASDLGAACGIAFDHDGAMYVGDRSGTIFRIGPSGGTTAFASLPPSIAAYHLAFGGDDKLYVTAPTLGTRDSIYRIDRHGLIETAYSGFGRPQGMAVDSHGDLYVAEALAGSSGIYRLRPGSPPELIITGPTLIGLAFSPLGAIIVSTEESAYRFD
jgi:sugar lactone lactonase YvrE